MSMNTAPFGYAAVFIDAGYWSAISRDYFRDFRINYERLAYELSEGVPILRNYWYDSLPYMPENPSPEDNSRYEAKARFLDYLKRIDNWTVSEGSVVRRVLFVKKIDNPSGRLPEFEKTKSRTEQADAVVITYEQKRVDVAFSVDLLTISDTGKITDAIIVSGDGDLIEPLNRAKLLYGVKITLWCHPENRSEELWRVADQRRIIDNDFIRRVSEVRF
jgi:uncharacterized LabA/DUF88 family protein